MPSYHILLSFLATAAVFAFVPGPSMLFAAAQTLAGGRWSGLMSSLGLHLGGYVHVIAAAVGLSIVFHAVPPLYLMVKFAGAAYLVWLGFAMFRSREAGGLPGAVPKSGRRAFLESITVEILNPKTAIFYLAFLPQFVDPGAGFAIPLQFLVLGVIVNAMFSAADLVAVALADLVMARLKHSNRFQRIIQRAGGSLLVALGASLALEKS